MKNLILIFLIDASFGAFPEAGSHLRQGTIEAPARKLEIQIKNSDYKKR